MEQELNCVKCKKTWGQRTQLNKDQYPEAELRQTDLKDTVSFIYLFF